MSRTAVPCWMHVNDNGGWMWFAMVGDGYSADQHSWLATASKKAGRRTLAWMAGQS